MAIGNFTLMGNAIRLFNIEMETVKLSDIGPKPSEPLTVSEVNEGPPEQSLSSSNTFASAPQTCEENMPCQEFIYPPNDMSHCK